MKYGRGELRIRLADALREVRKLRASVQEQRARRIEIEEELAASNQAYLERPPAVTKFVERKVYTPMPPRELKTRHYFPVDRPAGIFGRLGDRIDGWLLRNNFGNKKPI